MSDAERPPLGAATDQDQDQERGPETDDLALAFLQVQVLLQVGEEDTGLRAGLHLEQDGAWGVHLPPCPDAATQARQVAQVTQAVIAALRRAALTLEERLTAGV